MSEVLFYHLERSTLTEVLPQLLARSLERGWRIAISSSDENELAALDSDLWTAQPDSFLAHGIAGTKHDADQPILLSTTEANTNGAHILFLVHGAATQNAANYERVVDLFDGASQEAVQGARERFKAMRDAGHDVTYWLQDEDGRWAKAG